MVLRRLNISPAMYHDLTLPEVNALLEGCHEREVDAWRQTRLLATLIRNSFAKDAVTETEFMPLPGDPEKGVLPPDVLFHQLAAVMGGVITEES